MLKLVLLGRHGSGKTTIGRQLLARSPNAFHFAVKPFSRAAGTTNRSRCASCPHSRGFVASGQDCAQRDRSTE